MSSSVNVIIWLLCEYKFSEAIKKARKAELSELDILSFIQKNYTCFTY